MKKTEGYRVLFDLAKKDSTRATAIASLISNESIDLAIVLRYQKISDYWQVRNLSEALARRVPKEKLNLRLLIESQRSKDQGLRTLARDLALSIPASLLDYDVLKEYLKPGDKYVEQLTNKLARRYTLALKKKNLN